MRIIPKLSFLCHSLVVDCFAFKSLFSYIVVNLNNEQPKLCEDTKQNDLNYLIRIIK